MGKGAERLEAGTEGFGAGAERLGQGLNPKDWRKGGLKGWWTRTLGLGTRTKGYFDI